MKNFLLGLAASTLLIVVACSSITTDAILTKGQKPNSYIVHTDKLTQSEDFYGYEDHNIPLRIYISKGKIDTIEAYGHRETEEFFALVEARLLPKWKGLTVEQALGAKFDAVSGATYSSDAVIKSVKIGLEYAKKKGVK